MKRDDGKLERYEIDPSRYEIDPSRYKYNDQVRSRYITSSIGSEGRSWLLVRPRLPRFVMNERGQGICSMSECRAL
jgi:hypothetical protein